LSRRPPPAAKRWLPGLALNPELPKVMIEMPVLQDIPVAWPHPAEARIAAHVEPRAERLILFGSVPRRRTFPSRSSICISSAQGKSSAGAAPSLPCS
jgi:hypothetical protein